VTDWTISVPHRDRSDSLATVAGLARHLPAADRAVARQVAVDARVEHGLRTAGELIDHVGRLEPRQRRELLDTARERLGMPSTLEADIAAGAFLRTLAPDPRPMELHYSESGAIVERFGDERTTAELDERRRAVERQAREAERAAESAHVLAHQQALDERLARELPPHLKPLTEEAA
jgi:hypothetical protein